MGIRHFIARCIHNRIRRRVARRLDLDGTQQARFDALHDTLHELRDEARSGLGYQREALFSLLGQERIDREEALRLARVPVALVNDALPRAVERMAEFLDTLSADQRGRLRDMLERHGRCGHHPCSC